MDPIITPTLVIVAIGSAATTLISDTCKDYIKNKALSWVQENEDRNKIKRVYQDALEKTYSICLENLLRNIKGCGYENEELKQYKSSLELFIKDEKVTEELMNIIRDPTQDPMKLAIKLQARWDILNTEKLPYSSMWKTVAFAIRRQVTRKVILSPDLRDRLNAQNLQRIREALEVQNDNKIQVEHSKYIQYILTQFTPINLANLMSPYTNTPKGISVQNIFVAQYVRENPPPVEIPKDLIENLKKDAAMTNIHYEIVNEEQLKKLRNNYVNQSPRPILDVVTDPSHRLIVLTGEPGSGKSTLMHYLLTGILKPPINSKSGESQQWTNFFKGKLPLLIELKDFYALRCDDECDTFLEYVNYMGKTNRWFLDSCTAERLLDSGSALVMFDGLDEIFDNEDRERVMKEIAGFALRYPQTRIIVTSRPVGYKRQILQNAGFRHFGIQDLNDQQIETFIRSWFALTFPQHPQLATQRIKRVLKSTRQSKSIRLLAGNPMLLTIMALLAREDELHRERAKFYQKAVEILCHQWDFNRHLHLPEDHYLNVDDKKILLRRIATRMQENKSGLKGNFIHENELEQEILNYLIDEQWKTNRAEAKSAARRIISQLHERNYILCLREAQFYGFVHRTFLEYLTAVEYAQRFDKQPQVMTFDELLDLFEKHSHDDEWKEVLRLICGQINEQFVGKIIVHLLDQINSKKRRKETTPPELPLAILCLSECRKPAKVKNIGTQLMRQCLNTLSRFEAQQVDEHFDEWWFDNVIPASRELGERWPGKAIVYEFRNKNNLKWRYSSLSEPWVALVAAVDSNHGKMLEMTKSKYASIRASSLWFLAQKWSTEATRILLIERARQDTDGKPRAAALEALADKWPNEETRTLLVDRIRQDKDSKSRAAALWLLTAKWPNEEIQALLFERASQDLSSGVRSIAIDTLADNWPNETTKTLLIERAKQDKNSGVRSSALEALVTNWPEETTQTLLVERTKQDKSDNVRSTALESLATNWPDETTRTLLIERANQDKSDKVRSIALESLATNWPDETTRTLLIERAKQDKSDKVRSIALESLATNWPDKTTRTLLVEQAKQDKSSDVRSIALEVLANKWTNEATRTLLVRQADQDESDDVRSMVLNNLAYYWPNETTRRLLFEHAHLDISGWTRRAVLEIIIDNWPDELTRTLLSNQATKDRNTGVRSAALETLTDNWPDEVTRTLLFNQAIKDKCNDVRSTALDNLACYWPDETTRTLLIERTRQDKSDSVRSTALDNLAYYWPDESTRTLLSKQASQDVSDWIRRSTLNVLVDNWPDKVTRTLLIERAKQDRSNNVRSSALESLAINWQDEITYNLISNQASQDIDAWTRKTALRTLATYWPNETTRTLLFERANQDKNEDVRITALEVLALNWSDKAIRDLLFERVKQDASDKVRSKSIRVLTGNWPDEATRTLLIERANQDKSNDVRSSALWVLAENWPNKETRKLLVEQVNQAISSRVRTTVLRALAKNWQDKAMRNLLSELATQDISNDVRTTALQALVENWIDKATRTLLIERANQDNCDDVRALALESLADNWPDEMTHSLLSKRAIKDNGDNVRSTTLKAITVNWPDEATRTLLIERANQDKSNDVRSSVLRIMAENWPNKATRSLLIELANQDISEAVRSTALKAIADKWPDEEARILLIERANQDKSDDVRISALEALANHWPDEELPILGAD